MNGHSSDDWLLLFVTALVVVFLVFELVRRFWNYPLNHGTGFFLGVEVAPGFYSGEGVMWLERYRAVLLGEYLVVALALAAIGFRGLSMTPSAVGPVKAAIRSVDLGALRAFLTPMVEKPDHTVSIRRELQAFAEAHGVPI